MRISELSRTTGVPIPTVKFYLREGLLGPGTRIGRTQAEYSQAHVRRLQLIRALTEVGRLPLRDVQAVLRALDDEALGIHELLGTAHHALGPDPERRSTSPDEAEALVEVDGFIRELGWRVSAGAPARTALAQALVTLRRMGRDAGVDVFRSYAEVADQVAAREVATVSPASSRAKAVEDAVVGTVVFEAALVALRRLALEHHSAMRFSRGRPNNRRGRTTA